MLNETSILGLISGYDNKDEILDELESLSPDEELEVLRTLIGYEQMPPTIEEFVKDPYYLGDIYGDSIFPIWMERLKKLYPDPIRTSYTFVSAGGAIGTGKPRFSTIVSLYDYCKFSMISDPYKFLRIDPTTTFTMRYFNVNLPKAQETFLDPINIAFNKSPYFRELHRRCGGTAHGIRFKSASRPGHALSECIVSCVISEVNFFKKGMAMQIIDSVISRLESRMQLGFGFIPHVILDSSDTTEDSAVCDFIKSSPYASELIQFNTMIWEAKAHLGIYFNNGSFKVYAGDSEVAPFILDKKLGLDISKLDPDRIIECPNEVRSSFETNIELALQEKCCISIRSTDNFILDKDTVKSRFNLPLVTEETIVVDFYDKESIMSVVGGILDVLPIERRLYLRVDMGVSHDHCGIAIAYFDGMVKLSDESDKYYPSFKIPVAFGISRISGQETPINKVRDFILELADVREINAVSTDQYQSTQLRQELNQHGVYAHMISVDRNDNAYVTWKNLLMQDRCQVCENKKLRTELLDLKRYGRKIDHSAEGINSKDIADASAGAVFDAYCDLQHAAEPTKFTKAKVLTNVTESLSKIREIRATGALNNRNMWS